MFARFRHPSAFQRFSAATLGLTLAVILWGAYVRASGSGAGCGSHWPTCNGDVIPRGKGAATIIEYTHRTSSGLAFLAVAAQLVWALRAFPRGHGTRRAAGAAMAFMVTEAAVGAFLVLLQMVASNKSVARAAWMSAHLLNTFALLASLVLVLCAAAGISARAPAWRRAGLGLWIAVAATLLVATTGTIAALGDTLFPVSTFAEGLAQDWSASSHPFLRWRAMHPIFAVITGLGMLVVAGVTAARDRPCGTRAVATALGVAVLTQLGLGLANLVLRAPVPLQILHLLLADAIWLLLVVLVAALAPEKTNGFPVTETR